MVKKLKKILATLLTAVVSLCPLTACGHSDGKDHIVFCTYGDASELGVYKKMVDTFNDTYGAEHNIYVENTPIAVTGYSSYVTSMSTARESYDICLVEESDFKKWVNMGFLSPMSEYFDQVTDINVSDCFDNLVRRLRLNVVNNTSHSTDPLYGLPLDSKPSALYYNETMFEKAGIAIISVDAEDLDKWNNNEIEDKRGHKKSDFAKLANVTVPEKGYYRSKRPYTSGTKWQIPASDEIMVFNNRIPMNWDEMEDLAMIFTPTANANATRDYGTLYGMFTEWWFNYGWSVGGDCLQDLSGDGDWNYSLLDAAKNYIVTSDDGYTGEWTGRKYEKGETLEFNDKYDVAPDKVMKPDNDGGYTVDGVTVGVRPSVKAASSGENKVFDELPSMREAFARYLRLGALDGTVIEGQGGLNIAPTPLTFNNRTRQNYWYSQKMAMLIDRSAYIEIFSREAKEYGFAWDVAPLPVYKEYTQPMNPDCDDVKVRGKHAGECCSKAMVVRSRSQVKPACAQFIKWMASKDGGQKIKADNGFFPNQEELISTIQYPGYAPKNVHLFAESLSHQEAGDWWYLPDYAWIDVWSIPLNSEVRNGKKSYNVWKSASIADTNEKLKEYKRYNNRGQSGVHGN